VAVIIDTSDDDIDTDKIVETSDDDTSDAAEAQDTANVTNKFMLYIGAENYPTSHDFGFYFDLEQKYFVLIVQQSYGKAALSSQIWHC